MSRERIKTQAWIRDHALRSGGWDPPGLSYWLGSYGKRLPKVLSAEEKEELIQEMIWKLKAFFQTHHSLYDIYEGYSLLEKDLLRITTQYGIGRETCMDIICKLITSGKFEKTRSK